MLLVLLTVSCCTCLCCCAGLTIPCKKELNGLYPDLDNLNFNTFASCVAGKVVGATRTCPKGRRFSFMWQRCIPKKFLVAFDESECTLLVCVRAGFGGALLSMLLSECCRGRSAAKRCCFSQCILSLGNETHTRYQACHCTGTFEAMHKTATFQICCTQQQPGVSFTWQALQSTWLLLLYDVNTPRLRSLVHACSVHIPTQFTISHFDYTKHNDRNSCVFLQLTGST